MALADMPSRKARFGTVRIREWRGVAHQVGVFEKGVLYRGERYRSLSQVAWMIPGKSMVGTRLLRAQAKHGPR
jgi:hypothetical protein